MNEKNSIKDKIYSILIQKRLIIPDIKKELKKRYEIDISKSDIRVYLKRLFDKNKIKKLERDGRYVIYTAIEKEDNGESIEILKELYSLMNNKMDFIKTPDTNDIELIKKIELVIE